MIFSSKWMLILQKLQTFNEIPYLNAFVKNFVHVYLYSKMQLYMLQMYDNEVDLEQILCVLQIERWTKRQR